VGGRPVSLDVITDSVGQMEWNGGLGSDHRAPEAKPTPRRPPLPLLIHPDPPRSAVSAMYTVTQ